VFRFSVLHNVDLVVDSRISLGWEHRGPSALSEELQKRMQGAAVRWLYLWNHWSL